MLARLPGPAGSRNALSDAKRELEEAQIEELEKARPPISSSLAIDL